MTQDIVHGTLMQNQNRDNTIHSRMYSGLRQVRMKCSSLAAFVCVTVSFPLQRNLTHAFLCSADKIGLTYVKPIHTTDKDGKRVFSAGLAIDNKLSGIAEL